MKLIRELLKRTDLNHVAINKEEFKLELAR